MGYEIFFWVVIGFVAGRISKLKFYYGPDEEKYNNADFAILKQPK